MTRIVAIVLAVNIAAGAFVVGWRLGRRSSR